jgi:hypothetical protein
MIDVINVRCIHPDCKTQPTFNFENEKKAIYCATTKQKSSRLSIISKKHFQSKIGLLTRLSTVVGFSRRRPDLILHLKNHVIIIEVDENKHNTYECICENKRIMLISQDVDHKPILMLRFNPDKLKQIKKL